MEIVDFEVISDTIEGIEGGFMAVRRLHLRNLRDDGSRSERYVCDFVVRPKGVDAVVVAVYHRHAEGVRVLLRDGLRPALAKGRAPEHLPIPDRRLYLCLTEVVAGIIEHDDRGEEGVRRRAALEVEEEAGYVVEPSAVELLGAGSFPSPGSMPERFWLTAVEVADPSSQQPPQGDGSPMEEGATTRWMALDDAIAACVTGEIEDAKSELVLRRLREHLAR
ncbi:MAG: NUDIX domain-containing protein [Myxococcales bacterium]|nr:NUDIX domain-containing protein [Myxococcales bacterium]